MLFAVTVVAVVVAAALAVKATAANVVQDADLSRLPTSCPRPRGTGTTWTFRGARLVGEWFRDVDAVRCTWTPLQPPGDDDDDNGEPGELGTWACEHGGRMQCRGAACPATVADCRVHVHAEPPASIGAMLLLWAGGVAALAAAAVGVKRCAVRASRQHIAQLRKKNDGDGITGATGTHSIVDTFAVGIAGSGGGGGGARYNSQHTASDPDIPAPAFGERDVGAPERGPFGAGDSSSTSSVYIDIDPYGPSTPPVAPEASRPRFARGTLGSIVGNIGDSAGSGQHDRGVVGRARASGSFAMTAQGGGRASAEQSTAQQQQQQHDAAATAAAGGVLAL